VIVYRYPFRVIRRDLFYGAAGLVLCGGSLTLDLAPAVAAVLIPGAILCGIYGLRALLRLRTRVAVTDDTVVASGAMSGLFRTVSLRWDSLTGVSLGSYSAWREGEDGWMELRLKGQGGTIRLESTLEGFRDIVRRAALAAAAGGLVLDAATAGNLRLLDVATPVEKSEGG
jgi:hypothetical protein